MQSCNRLDHEASLLVFDTIGTPRRTLKVRDSASGNPSERRHKTSTGSPPTRVAALMTANLSATHDRFCSCDAWICTSHRSIGTPTMLPHSVHDPS